MRNNSGANIGLEKDHPMFTWFRLQSWSAAPPKFNTNRLYDAAVI